MSRRVLFHFALWLALAGGLRAAAIASAVELRVKVGDDPRWAEPGWDDRDWPAQVQLNGVRPLTTIPVREGIVWLRFRAARSPVSTGRPVLSTFLWPQDEPGSPINSLFIAAVYAFELYWDGELVGRSGIVGSTRAAETAGRIDNLIRIPDRLLGPGEHVVALRISSFHYNFPAPRTGVYLAFENDLDRLRYESRLPITPLIGMGGALLMAAFCAALYAIVDRRAPLLWATALSAAIALYYLLVAWRWLHNDRYDWLWPRYVLVTATMTVICGLLTWLLLLQFAPPRRGRWLAALAPLLLAAWLLPFFHWDKVAWQCRATLGFALVIVGRAVWQKQVGARIVLLGVVIGLTGVRAIDRNFITPAFLASFGGLVLCLIAGLGTQLASDRRSARDARLLAARLETELLKKNIQPHFLLNTLATIEETIEQEPRTAVALVAALAGEFRILSRVAGEKLIPLAQELELCREHLAVMSLRKGARCTLVVTGADEQTLVPPALFHTLIENGLTHLLPRNGEQRFELQAEARPAGMRYTLVVHGEPVERGGAGRAGREGTGLRYIKARLEESFAGRWILEGEPIPGGWRTVIQWRDHAGKAALA